MFIAARDFWPVDILIFLYTVQRNYEVKSRPHVRKCYDVIIIIPRQQDESFAHAAYDVNAAVYTDNGRIFLADKAFRKSAGDNNRQF